MSANSACLLAKAKVTSQSHLQKTRLPPKTQAQGFYSVPRVASLTRQSTSVHTSALKQVEELSRSASMWIFRDLNPPDSSRPLSVLTAFLLARPGRDSREIE
ncbi:MAG: hypothetical protein OHK93_007809 [Ramalina farinacea]|uniref:Uncharacterized protein n=1 Tax=Ramalina farinacea TaxID=258253 RepID=A0AA43TUQ2_9LECA|nr:hypothetical protein [Ramalina farinacea]